MCIGDEEIDITTCTVGTDTSELPVEARLRAQKEHTRFTDQSEEERERELKGLAQIRKDVGKGRGRRRQSKRPTERSREEEMLGALSAEFPHIYFGAQASKDKDKDKDKEEGRGRAGGYICRAIVQLLQRVYTRCIIIIHFTDESSWAFGV